MSFYDNLASVATKLLTDKGQQVTINRAVTNSFNPVTGIITPGTATNIVGYGAAFDYNANQIDGTLVQNGDIRFILEPTDEPAIEDTVVIDSDTYKVISVKKTAPAGIVVNYELQLRK